MKVRWVLSILLLVFAGGNSVAQRDFRSAFIVRIDGDTLNGEADFSNGVNHFKLCRFRAGSDITEYKPEDLAAYGFRNDRFFVSRPVEAGGPRVFVELIVKGEVSLYRHLDDFYLEKDTSFVQLTNPSVRTRKDGNEIVHRSRKYRGVANLMMGNCPDVRKEIETLNLNERSLTELVEHYNQCKNVSWVSYKGKKPWIKSQWGVEAGFSSSSFTAVHGTYSNSYLNGPYTNSQTWIAGITLDILSPRINESMFIRTGASFTHPKYYGYNQYQSGSTLNTNYVTLDISQLKVPLGVAWRILAGKYKPYIMGGLMNSIVLQSSTRWLNEAETNGVMEVTEQEAAGVNAYQMGFWGGLGVARTMGGSLEGSLEIRFEKISGILQSDFQTGPLSVEVKSDITYFQVVAGIRFK